MAQFGVPPQFLHDNGSHSHGPVDGHYSAPGQFSPDGGGGGDSPPDHSIWALLPEMGFNYSSNFSSNASLFEFEEGMGDPLGRKTVWGWWLTQTVTPAICLVGIPGNILSFLVMRSTRMRYKAYVHYLRALAVFDSFVLVFKYFRRLDSLLESMGHKRLYAYYGDGACKIHNFVEYVCLLMSSWLVLCIALERFISVNYPFKKDKVCTPRRSPAIIIALFTFLSYTQIFRLVLVGKFNKWHDCLAHDEKVVRIYVALHVYMYQMVLQFLIPVLVITICNVLILRRIKELRYSVAKHGTVHSKQVIARKHKTTCMLLLVSFAYLFTFMPLVLISVVLHFAIETDVMVALKIMLDLRHINPILEVLNEVNYAVNFFIYVYSEEHFRVELRRMCFKKKRTYCHRPDLS